MSDWLVTTEWLSRNLSDPNVVVLDCSWYLPEAGKKAIDDFRNGHIPGARFLDLTAVSDPDSPFANMLPRPEQWAREVGRLGVGNNSLAVVYDAGYVSARVWWMFRVFGHDNVRILDGGWRKWKAEGRPVETGDGPEPSPRLFVPHRREGMAAGWREVLAAIKAGSPSIVDARTATRFEGASPSGYPGIPSGHMPGAINIPWEKFFDRSKNYSFIDADAAARLFSEAGVDTGKPIITSCGSGVTAAILGFMLERGGNRAWKLYDGSWHEWAQLPDVPKESAADKTSG